MPQLRAARTPLLEIAYLESGPAEGPVAVLLHGFPYDVHCYDEVARLLTQHGMRVIVPYLRGYGPTRFLSDLTPRSGQQAALGQDLIDLLDAIGIDHAVVGGYDWGGRAACIVAALHPDRVVGLVTVGGYNIQEIARADEPLPPLAESRNWYIDYLQSERGRAGLARHRAEFALLLWHQWSPTWAGADAAFPLTEPSFDNPDFVDVVVHSYRVRRRATDGDPRYAEIEAALAKRPPITVPTIALDALEDGFGRDESEADRAHFTGGFRVEEVAAGHDLPQQRPGEFAAAIAELAGVRIGPAR
jgi:pimeloyl-ACP methyl ester carboxylesterase